MGRTWLAAAVGLALAGCAVDQAREVGQYRGLVDLAAPTYHAGQPLDVRGAMLLTNAALETLDIEGEAYLRALIERRRAVAGFLPTVNLTGSHLWRDSADSDGGSGGGSSSSSSSSSSGSGSSSSGSSGGSSSGGSSSGGDSSSGGSGSSSGDSSGSAGSSSSSGSGSSASSSSSDDSYTINGRLEWNVFNGFRDWNAYWRDTFLIDQRRAVLLDVQEQVLIDAAQVFLEVLRAEASVRVLESSLAVQGERLRNTRGRLEVGFARILDVAQSEAQYAATETELVNARRDVGNARDMLSFLTAVDLTSATLLPAAAAPPLDADPAPLEALARTHRQDLLAADAALAAAQRDLKIALGQYYPRVSLNLDAYLVSEPIPASRDWQAALQVTQPLFAQGRIRADVRESWSFIREARLVRERLDRQVRREVHQARREVLTSVERLRQLDTQTRAASQAFEQADASYVNGLATNLDRVAAQDALLRAQLAQTSEQFDNQLYYLQLLRACGTLRERFFDGATANTGTEDAAAQAATSTGTAPATPTAPMPIEPAH